MFQIKEVLYKIKPLIFLLSLHRAFFEICPVHTPTDALFINLVESFKFILKYTIISPVRVSVFNDHHHGAFCVPD